MSKEVGTTPQADFFEKQPSQVQEAV